MGKASGADLKGAQINKKVPKGMPVLAKRSRSGELKFGLQHPGSPFHHK